MPTPVLIVGAGPTGLVMALWLARAGVPFRIIDKNTGPGQASRAMVVQARTLEFYRQLGIADEVIAAGIQMRSLRLRQGPREVAGFAFNDIGQDISPYPFVLSFPQDDHERLLVKALEAAGGKIEWNTRLASFTSDAQGVHATLDAAGVEEQLDCNYLVGCDGAHSTVRQMLALDFPGGTYQDLFYVADVAANGLMFNADVNACISADGFSLAFPIRSTGMFRLIGVVPHELAGKEHLTFEDIRPHVHDQLDADIAAVNWFSTYRVHHRVAAHFRAGPVFLAGDAGHLHSPAGGQGMNTGIGDAINLAWKLAEVVTGRAPSTLLDTYEPERITFARSLVATTDRIFQTIVGQGPASTFFRSFFIPHIAPRLLHFRAARRAMFRVVSQTRIHYRPSPLSTGAAGGLKAGDRLPWLFAQDNYQPLTARCWQIHLFSPASPAVCELAENASLPIHVFQFDSSAETAGFAAKAIYLVRPDGYLGFVHREQAVAPLTAYLLKHFHRGRPDAFKGNP